MASNDQDKREVDEVTGTETTGHEWDGIKELDTPMPRWWLYIFYITIAWSVLYMILMPAWPLLDSYTKGILGQSDRLTVAQDLNDLKAERQVFTDRLVGRPIEEIAADEGLQAFALAAGQSAFGDNCATCHGSGAQGFEGYPNLNDDVWLWGGTLEDIRYTLLYGIRSGHEQARFSLMPSFGRDGLLTEAQIRDVVEYVLQLSGQDADAAAAARAAETWETQCGFCHGPDGKGMQALGSPNLTDAEWLYGGDRETLYNTIWFARNSVMPYWSDRLDESTINALAIYVHSLGGGE